MDGSGQADRAPGRARQSPVSHGVMSRSMALRLLQPHEEATFADSARYVTAIGVTIIAVVAAGVALYFGKPVFLPIATAAVLGVLLAPATEWLRRRGLPNSVGSLFVVAFFFSLFIGALYLIIQPGAAWLERLPEMLTDARKKLIGVEEAVNKVQDVSEQVDELAKIGDEQRTQSVKVDESPSLSAALASFLRTILIQVLFTTVLTYFFLASRLDIRRKLILIRTKVSGRRQMARMLGAVEKKVGSYMFTMLMINLGLGVATAVAMQTIGMPSPLVWGGLAALLNFIPYLGPITLTALLGVSGLVNYDEALMMAAPAGIYIALNFIESNFVTPLLIGQRLTMSPLAVILNISFWTWIWGPAGAIISIPVLVIVKTICDHSTFLRPIGVLLGNGARVTYRPT
ncbi:AI-2E family transporter [Hyphococcus flavus]|uniref:AI-2E family transporter n=1 Tax=Hyphococcus flavus TaxID=1866326 RepID=A0AAE9ZF87_9PROT|nr:AI-2E family transporter [Hyphococcus flavus]WDI32690.1 AI-2E family transporter [Hyphococcus flavus]